MTNQNASRSIEIVEKLGNRLENRGEGKEREGGGRMARPSLLEDVGGEVELKFDRFPSLLSISFENFPPLPPFLILRFFFFFENKIKLDVEV